MPKRRRKKKKRLKIGRLILALLILGSITFGCIYGVSNLSSFAKGKIKLNVKNYYLASKINTIELYNYNDETKTMNKIEEPIIYRGEKVKSLNKTKTIEDEDYIEITLDDTKYYVKKESLVDTKDKVVLEKEKYVRTSVTVYQNKEDSKISSFIKKGNSLTISGYDYIDDTGKVNMYKITKDDIEGWVYGKYLVDTLDEAKANYNEKGVYDIHKNRKYSYELYGGKASTLDYYPYERVEFKDNKLLENAKTMYLNAGGNVISGVDSYLEIAKSNGVNAMVVDLKDGALAYPIEAAKNYSMTAYNNAINSKESYKTAIDKIKAANIYVIGRIVVFNDSHYAKDNPSDCIQGMEWPSAFSRKAWEYNVELAKDAIKDMGFNEIQFDYVRFPERSFDLSKLGRDFKNKYNEEKAEAIQNFLYYALDQIHKENVYLSVDVFGECSSEYVTAYGQYWPAISNIVDVISSMPYTDHFGRTVNTWSNPYQTVYNWAKGAAARQTEIPTPAIARTWVTAYDTPHWNPTVVYDASKISDQAQALVDAGLKGGFITWNSASNIYKYRQIASAFAKDYS